MRFPLMLNLVVILCHTVVDSLMSHIVTHDNIKRKLKYNMWFTYSNSVLSK